MTHISRRAARRAAVEWPTLGLIAGCYALWLTAGIVLWPVAPVFALGVLTLTVALHSSLVHEVLHGHPTRSAALNELLVSLPIGLLWPYRRFKTLHLRHHADERLTDPFDDPESYYRALWQHEQLPGWLRALLRVNNTMAGRFVLGPWLAAAGFLAGDWKLLRAGDRDVRKAWLLHLASLTVAVPVIVFAFGVPLWLYVLVPMWFGQSLIAIRTFAEHQWSEDPEGRTIIVERSPLAWLFLNNNLHFVHHKCPTAPWYRLPAMFHARREQWLTRNRGYSYPNYLALLKAYAFRAKEPVVHPVLRRASDPARAFTPRQRSGAPGYGAGTAPIPAEPQKR